MEGRILFVQISDTHIGEPGSKTCKVAPMADNLERCVDAINAMIPKPDLVLLSGDVTHDFTHSQTEHAYQILSKLNCAFYIIPGNHDDRALLSDVFGSSACPKGPEGFINYVIEGLPLRIIALDSVDQGKPGGMMCRSRLKWLRNCLEQAPDQPTAIFMHHPPLKLGVPETDADGFSGAEQLADIIANYSNIEAILCGHIHLTTSTGWCGTVVKTAPSPGMQLKLDLGQKKESQFLLSDPAFLLHHWTPDKVLATHLIQVSNLPGPFDFC